MMEKLFKQMMEEKHDFYHYMGLYQMCSDPAIKTKLHAIASQEVQHYKEQAVRLSPGSRSVHIRRLCRC